MPNHSTSFRPAFVFLSTAFLLAIALCPLQQLHADGGDPAILHACRNNNSGTVSIVDEDDDCTGNQTALHLVPTTINGEVELGGELFLGEDRTSLAGFDGAGMHWLRTDGQESKLWLGFRQSAAGNPLKIRVKPRMKFDRPVSIKAEQAEGTLHVFDIGTTGPAVYIEGGSATEGDITWKNNEHLQVGTWNPDANTFSEKMRITGAGRVGIGTDDPPRKLSVSSNNHQLALIDSDNSDKTWTLTSVQDISGFGIYEDGAAGRLVIESGGNVGVGTTNPSADLHVSGGNGSAELLVEADRNNSGEGNQPRIALTQDGGAVEGEFGYFGATNDLRVINNFGGAKIVLEADGDVCIGSGC